MGMATPPTRFVGRDTELALLRAGLDATVHGHAAAVFVAGESGVGKTRLLAELAALARQQNVPVLSGVAIDVGDGAPFWPVRDGLRGFLRNAHNSWALDVAAPWAHGLAQLIPGIPLLPDDPATRGCREQSSLDLLVQVVIALVSHGPLLVLLDDMQWSDQSSRLLVTYLLAILTDEPLMLVIAYRDDIANDGQGIHELALELQRSRRARIVPLRPLSHAAVSDLVGVNDRALVDFIWQRSGGNAFLVEEMVGYCRDSGALGIPDTLRDLVRARIRLLPEPVCAVLRALAVGDEPVSHRVLAEVAELDEPDLLVAVRAAVAAGVIRVPDDGDGYCLRHGIVKDVLDGDLLPGDRLRLHRRHAEALERFAQPDFRTVASLAKHWDRAEDWPRALSASVAAAHDAERAYGFAEAQEHLLRALSLADRVGVTLPERAGLQEQAARAADLAGDHETACDLLRQRLTALPSEPDTTSARLYGELGRCLSAAGRVREAVDAHARAVALLPDDAPPDARVRVLAGHAEALADTGRYGESHKQAEVAAEIADQAGLAALRARILPTLGCSLAYLGYPEEGLAALSEGLRVATATGAPEDIARGHVGLCNLLCGPLNNLDEGIAAGRRAIDVVADLGLARTFGVQLQAIVANALFRIGDWSAAGELVEEALAAAPTGTAAIELRLARCRLLVGRGEFRTAEQELDVLATLCDQTVGPRYQAPLLTLRAGLAMWQGRPDVAREHVARGLHIAGQNTEDIWVLAPLVWHGLRAEAEAAYLAASRGSGPEPGQVELLREQMRELVRRSETAAPGVRASVLGYLQLCDAEASRVAGTSDPRLWALAADTWADNSHPYPAAYCRYHQAEALFAQRARAAGALEALAAAHRTAHRLGAWPLQLLVETLAKHAAVVLPRLDQPLDQPLDTAQEADAAAPRTGADARRPGPAVTVPAQASPYEASLARLTERERLVLAVLAEGRTNRQIARRLFISEKTVSVHVSHILAKLEVNTRVEAAMLVHRFGGLAAP